MFDEKKVKEVSKLARIDLNADDVNFFSREIIDFLKLVEKTEKIDLTKTAPLYHAPETSIKLREDNIDDDPKNDGINSAPEHDGPKPIIPPQQTFIPAFLTLLIVSSLS